MKIEGMGEIREERGERRPLHLYFFPIWGEKAERITF